MNLSKDPVKSSKELIENSESEYYRERDAKINRETTPDPDEHIRIPVIWVFEAFPPSFIRNLRISSEKLGWNDEERALNPIFPDSIDDMRARFLGGGWLNLGYIVSESEKYWPMMPPRKAPLPEGVKMIRASVLQYIPSTTIFVGQFFMNEDAKASLEQPLNQIYKTYKKPLKGGGYSIEGVEKQKKAAVEGRREFLRRHCTNWIREYMPGLFASGIMGDYFPACELILLAKNNPFIQVGDLPQKSFLGMLGLDYNCRYNAWISDNLKGLYLNFVKGGGDDNGRIVMSGNENEMLDDEKLNMFGEDNRQENIISYTEFLDDTLGLWTLNRIAQSYEKRLGAIRDACGA
jgi:hypothetical protein